MLAWFTWKGGLGFVGDYRQGVTPVPIPNTEVKPLSPMILLSGKVGYRRLDGFRRGTLRRNPFFVGNGIRKCRLSGLEAGALLVAVAFVGRAFACLCFKL